MSEQQLEERVRALEEWKSGVKTDAAVRLLRDQHLDKRFDHLEKSVDEIKGYLLKIVWVIVIGVVGSLLTFMLSGGLSIVP